MIETIPIFGISIKIALLIFMVFYMVFGVVMVRQVLLMTETLEVGFETPVKIIAFLHLALTIAVFFLALFII